MNDELFWSYFAGCIDCDGWVTISKHKTKNDLEVAHRYVVGLTQHINCREGMMTIHADLVSRGISCTLVDRDSNTVHKTPMLNIHIKQRDSIIKCLNGIIPHLRFKKEKAIEALNYTVERMIKNPRSFDLLNSSTGLKRYWTNEETQKVQNLFDRGFNKIYIANALSRSYNSVLQKMQRMGLTRYEIAP